MQRRHLLQLGLAATLPGTRLWAAAPGTPRLLVVFLRGAYDAASLLVPVASPFYDEARPSIAIARDATLPLDGDWGLAPALADSLHPLWQQGQAAFVPFAGTHDLSRSHFETQDRIERGQPDDPAPGRPGGRDFRSGFLNRLAGVLGAGPQAMAFTDQLPLILRGGEPVANQALRELGRGALDAAQARAIAGMYAGSRLAGAVGGGFAVRDEVSRTLAGAGEMEAASRGAIPARGFALEAWRVARLMREHVALGFIDVGGWDTHAAQGGATGPLANRLGELGRGLALFADEMGPRWRDTVVVVLSEFGRTFRENGSRGTDHGHGSVYWVLGGGLRGARVAGEQVAVAAATLHQGRDYPVLNEYRALLGGLFQRLYGLGDAQLAAVFPGARPRDLGLV
ncbi:MAG: DUF1501 domain-containing protein [Roseateles sp.]|uniref:DUF1501 domain-containing protein n=1 Tax=Roseateles sp. TaxID=1971397 RepID=UPI0039E87AF9